MAKRLVKRNAAADVVVLGDAFEMFIDKKQADNKAPTTIANYKNSYKLFCEALELNNSTPVNEITTEDIYKWKNKMLGSDVRAASINHYLRDIRCFLYWCMKKERGYLEEFEITMIEEGKAIPKCYSDDDVSILLEKPHKNERYTYWRDWAIFNWVMATGNRATTVCNIQMEDVNLVKKEIILKETKNHSQQIIPLSSALESVIREYIRVWRSGDNVNGESYLFASISEEKLNPNSLYHSFSNYAASRGVSKSGIHAMRHTFARGFVRNNGNVFVLQKVLGHKKLDMTKRYVDLFSDDFKQGYDNYSPLDTIKKASKRTQTMKRNK